MASAQVEAGAAAAAATSAADDAAAERKSAEKKSALREQALADRGGFRPCWKSFRGDPRRRGNVNIQEMMKQAQQMQERLQKEMTELRVEGNAGGGMVTVAGQRRQAGAVDHDRSGGRLERRRRDAAGPDRRRHQRRASQGRRGHGAEDGRDAARA